RYLAPNEPNPRRRKPSNPTTTTTPRTTIPQRTRTERARQRQRYPVKPPGFSADPETAIGQPPQLDLSVVVPVYNEEESLPQLIREVHEALDDEGLTYELILVDDGSTDRSFEVMRAAAELDAALTVIRFRRNFGQTAALQAGIDAARGARLVLMDA